MAKISQSKLRRILNTANKSKFQGILKECKPSLFTVRDQDTVLPCDNCSTTTTTTTVN